MDRDWDREVKEIGLEAFSRQHDDNPFETELAKVAIEGESMVESMMVDQSKAGAIDKAEFFVVVSYKNRPCRVFDGVAHMEDFDPRLIETFHEFNRRIVADFEADQRIGFGEDQIRC